MILTVTLNAAIDKRYVVNNFKTGEVNRVKECTYVPFFVFQNLHKHSTYENACQLFHFMIPADCGNDFPNALLCCNEGKANIFLVKTKYFSNIFIEIYDRI